ncbi:hypothetical protein [Oceanirhabdus sp. W0125-5]|uniref:hypothetical protein n=1 Tax=Oceanirhabdus sp. W0125-5 TaxID=2999116 RepID=UPI0022F2F3AF|nr:hypothetical protein [Oceanirhabdus sp. W0125-5]WBW97203.1 hypothetical protein OW730_26470 [Oceanirhabdus sp. W0125-5]
MRNNNNCDKGLYFMLGAMMTALGCMGYCMCKSNGHFEKLKCHNENGNGNDKNTLKKMGKRHLGHKCHHGRRRHGIHKEYEGYQMPENEQVNE